MKYIKIMRKEGCYIHPVTDALSALSAELENLKEEENNVIISFKLIEMTEKEYNALPEFKGY